MTRLLIVAAGFALSISAANACEYQRSAKAKVDQTVVASIVTDEAKPMTNAEQPILLDGKAPVETAPAK